MRSTSALAAARDAHHAVKRLILTALGRAVSEARRSGRRDARTGVRSSEMEYGSQISVDSATLMNKGLEVIEANWLFASSRSRSTW